MIDLNYIKNFFPPQIANNPLFAKQMLKEYLLLMILDYISSSEYVSRLSFIGGTNHSLRNENFSAFVPWQGAGFLRLYVPFASS